MLSLVAFVVVGYLSGSVLYSRLIATHFLNVDISSVGDGNPGTFNAGLAGGVLWGTLVFLLEVLKAAIPVGVAYWAFGIIDWRIVPIAIAPPIGHAYPLFFDFDGGKGIAAISGAWAGMTLWMVMPVGGILLAFWYLSVEESAWATLFMVFSVALYLILIQAPQTWFAYLVVSLIFLTWTHRKELPNPPGVKPWVKHVAGLWHRSS